MDTLPICPCEDDAPLVLNLSWNLIRQLYGSNFAGKEKDWDRLSSSQLEAICREYALILRCAVMPVSQDDPQYELGRKLVFQLSVLESVFQKELDTYI